MNRSFLTASAAAAALLSILVGLSGCGGSSAPSKKEKAKANAQALIAQQRTVVRASSSFAINPGTQTKIKLAGVTITPGAPGVVQAGAAVIPADSGHVIAKHLIGSLHGTASITFAKGPKALKFDKIVVNTSTRRVSGIVNGKRETLYHLHLGNIKVVATKDTRYTGTGITVTLAKQAAALLNKALQVNIFRAKQPFGVLTLDVFVTPPKAPAAPAVTGSTASTASATTTSTTAK